MYNWIQYHLIVLLSCWNSPHQRRIKTKAVSCESLLISSEKINSSVVHFNDLFLFKSLKELIQSQHHFNKELTVTDNEKCDRWGTGKQMFSSALSLSQNTTVRVKLSVLADPVTVLLLAVSIALSRRERQLKRKGKGVN